MPRRKKKKEVVEWKNRIVRYGDIDLAQALANELNWRIHPYEQAQAMDAILEEVGIVQNVIVNLRTSELWPKKDRNVETFLDGHLRATRALEKGIPKFPATYVDLNPNEERQVLLAFDRIGSMAKTDEDKLKELFTKTKAEDEKLVQFFENFADDYGMQYGEVKKEITDIKPKVDKAKELISHYDVKDGDLWGLDEHRLICGDSMDPEIVRRLLEPGGKKIYGKMMSTDPPYMVDYDGDNRPGGGTNWSQLYEESSIPDKFEFLFNVLKLWQKYLSENAPWIIWHASGVQIEVEQVLQQLDILVHQQIIWAKPVPVIGYNFYNYQHEPAFFGWKRGHKPYVRSGFFSGQNKTIWNQGFDGTMELDEVLAILQDSNTFWEVDFQGKKRIGKVIHPTEKPLELFARPMRNHTHIGDICLEPFSGSGSQILAGQKTERIVYASDRQTAFVAVTLDRFERATGITPVLIERGNNDE